MFRKHLPVLLVELEHVEEGSEQGWTILAIRLIRSHTGLQFSARLGNQSFAVNLEQLCRFFSPQELLPKLESDLLGLHFVLAFRATLIRFGLSHFGLLPSPTIDWNAHSECQHVVGAKLRGVGPLPQVLEVEVRIEILLGKV